jgi:membrane fusion protein (multidrug efflux system)
MKKAIVLIIVLAILALIVYRVATFQKGEPAQSITDIQRTQGVPVEVQTVESNTLNFSRHFSGTVEGYSQTNAIAHLMESVKEVKVKVGDRVLADDVLVILNKDNPQAQYQQARLARDNAVREYNRISALFEQGAVSRQAYDQATLARDIAESNFSNAKKLVEITAPIEGMVTDVKVKPGEVVSPGDPVVTISAIDRVKCELWVGDADRHRIKEGQTAYFTTSASNPASGVSNNLTGEVTEVALSADHESHLYKIIVEADNSQGWFRPGQLVSVQVIIESIPDLLLIPKDAVIYQNEKPYVFKVEGSSAVLRPIEVGRQNRAHLEIAKGLSHGDTIVVYGMNRLKSGDKVKIVSLSEEAADVSQ